MSINDIIADIKERYAIIANFISAAQDYIRITGEIVVGLNPRLYDSYMKVLADLNKQIAEEIVIRPDTLLADVSRIYDHFDITYDLDLILMVVNNDQYEKMVLYNKTQSIVFNIKAVRDQILKAYNDYAVQSTAGDEKTLMKVIHLSGIYGNADIGLAFIDELISSHKYPNKLHIYIIKYIMSKVNRPARMRLNRFIERQKDIMLHSENILISNPVVVPRYHLTPISKLMSGAKLFGHIGIPAKYNDDAPLYDNIMAFFGKRGGNSRGLIGSVTGRAYDKEAGFIIMKKLTPNIVEYNVAGLINEKYIAENDLMTVYGAGLNKRILKRYATIVKLSCPEREEQSLFNIIGENRGKYYVIESLCTGKYRLIGVDPAVPTTSAHHLSNVLEGISSRPYHYNESVSLSPDEYLDEGAESIIIAYEEMNNNLSEGNEKRQIIEDMRQYIEKSINHKTPDDFGDLLAIVTARNVIVDILLHRLPHDVGAHGEGRAEYAVSYIIKMDEIVGAFLRELEIAILAKKPSPLIFKELVGADLKRRLIIIAMEAVEKAVGEISRLNKWTDYDISLKQYFMDKKYIIM